MLSRRSIGLVLVLGTLATALVVTLWPFRFHFSLASVSRIDWRLYYRDGQGNIKTDRDLLQNLVMLAPLGAGWALLRGPRGIARIALETLALGLLVSVSIETLQIFDRGRFPQLADVWRNTLGCVVGGVIIAAGVLSRHGKGAGTPELARSPAP